MSSEIVKVQRPVFSTDPEGPWLIYDRARKHVEQVPDRLVPRHVKKAMRGAHVAFFLGAWSSVVGWGLSKRVGEQTW